MASQITQSPVDCLQPFWHPDGTRIYYLSGPVGNAKLAAVGAGGGAPEVVLENVSQAAISPDGKALAVLREDRNAGQWSLWFSSPPGAKPQPYTQVSFPSTGSIRGSIQFSPNASSVGISTGLGGHFWIIPYPSGEPRRSLVRSLAGSLPLAFSWMPDRHVAIAVRFRGTAESHLWIADTHNDTARQVSLTGSNEMQPAVAPDGNKIAFTSTANQYDVVQVPLDGSGMRNLHATARNETDPSWSPAGNQLAYATDRNGRLEIWLRSQQEGWDRPLVTDEYFPDATRFLGHPTFSPDGRRIAYRRLSDVARGRIWISSVAGGRPGRLPGPDTEDQGYPAWSPDGNWIAYVSGVMTKPALRKTRSGGSGQSTVLKEGLLSYHHPQWSPAGEWISFATSQGLELISADGQNTRVLAKGEWLIHGWNREGSQIIAVRQSEQRRLLLAMLDVRTGRETTTRDLGPSPFSPWTVILFPTPLRGFSLVPDGKSFATSILRTQGDIWLLEGFQRKLGALERIRLRAPR